MSTELLNTVKSGIAAIEKKYDSRIADLETETKNLETGYRELIQMQPSSILPGSIGGGGALTKAMQDDRIRSFQSDKGIKTASITLNMPLSRILSFKNTVVGVASGAGTDTFSVQAQRDPRLAEMPMRRLSLLEALPHLPCGSNSFEYNALSAYSNLAAIQPNEGTDLGATAAPTALKTAKIATIGHYLRLSEQVVADSPALLNQMETLLRYGLLHKASAEIIAGVGAVIESLEAQAGSYVAASDKPFSDAIGEAATELQILGWSPDLVVMHPTLWQTIRADRSAVEGMYITGGWAMPSTETIWGMRVVTDPACDVNVPMVLDSSQVVVLDRMDARVELGRSGTDYADATVLLRGMIRIGLAVFSPSAVVQVVVP